MPSTLRCALVKKPREDVFNVIIQFELPICDALLSYKEPLVHLQTKAALIAD